jgi:O-antigen/teichoic acid export membrane protein
MRKLISIIPRLATNYFILSGAELFSKILATIAFAYLARALGPQIYGYLEFVLALALIGTLLVDFGLSSIGAREIAKDTESTKRLFVHITALRFIFAVGTFSLFVILARWIDQPQPVRNLILLYGLTMFALPLLIQWVFQGHDRMQYVALASVVRWSILTLGILLFINSASNLWLVTLIEITAILSAALILIAFFIRSFGMPSFDFDRQYGLNALRKSAPIGASELVWAVKVYFATITLGLVISGPDVGWFTSAHRIVISLHAFVWLYFYNLLPSIARSSQQPVAVLNKLMAASLTVTAWAAVFIGVFGTAFSKVIINLFYGSQYNQAASVFSVLIWLIPLALLSGHYRYTLIGYDHQKYEFLSAFTGAVVNVGLSLYLIPRMGYLGAAWAIVVSELIIWGLAVLFVGRMVAHISILPHLWRPLIAGVISAGLLYVFIPINLFLAVIIATMVFILILFSFNPNLVHRIRSMAFQNQAIHS